MKTSPVKDSFRAAINVNDEQPKEVQAGNFTADSGLFLDGNVKRTKAIFSQNNKQIVNNDILNDGTFSGSNPNFLVIKNKNTKNQSKDDGNKFNPKANNQEAIDNSNDQKEISQTIASNASDIENNTNNSSNTDNEKNIDQTISALPLQNTEALRKNEQKLEIVVKNNAEANEGSCATNESDVKFVPIVISSERLASSGSNEIDGATTKGDLESGQMAITSKNISTTPFVSSDNFSDKFSCFRSKLQVGLPLDAHVNNVIKGFFPGNTDEEINTIVKEKLEILTAGGVKTRDDYDKMLKSFESHDRGLWLYAGALSSIGWPVLDSVLNDSPSLMHAMFKNTGNQYLKEAAIYGLIGGISDNLVGVVASKTNERYLLQPPDDKLPPNVRYSRASKQPSKFYAGLELGAAITVGYGARNAVQIAAAAYLGPYTKTGQIVNNAIGIVGSPFAGMLNKGIQQLFKRLHAQTGEEYLLMRSDLDQILEFYKKNDKCCCKIDGQILNDFYKSARECIDFSKKNPLLSAESIFVMALCTAALVGHAATVVRDGKKTTDRYFIAKAGMLAFYMLWGIEGYITQGKKTKKYDEEKTLAANNKAQYDLGYSDGLKANKNSTQTNNPETSIANIENELSNNPTNYYQSDSHTFDNGINIPTDMKGLKNIINNSGKQEAEFKLNDGQYSIQDDKDPGKHLEAIHRSLEEKSRATIKNDEKV